MALSRKVLSEMTPDKETVLQSLKESINKTPWIATELFSRRQTQACLRLTDLSGLAARAKITY